MSLSGKPASRRRLAMASEAAVTLPTESVVLISMSSLKMLRESWRVASSSWAKVGEAIERRRARKQIWVGSIAGGISCGARIKVSEVRGSAKRGQSLEVRARVLGHG